MHLAYLAALVLSILGTALIDHRWRLFVFARPRAGMAVLAAGVLFFTLWDALAIALGIFFRGDSPYLSGVMVGPEFPVEELFFLTLLCWSAMVAWTGAHRWLGATGEQP